LLVRSWTETFELKLTFEQEHYSTSQFTITADSYFIASANSDSPVKIHFLPTDYTTSLATFSI